MDALSNLHSLFAQLKQDAQLAKVYVMEVFLCKALQQHMKGKASGNEDDLTNAVAALGTQMSFLASNKLGVSEADIATSLMRMAKKTLP